MGAMLARSNQIMEPQVPQALRLQGILIGEILNRA